MSLTVLSVAYPLAPVRPDTAGGAEQVLLMLDAALTRAGHRSIVVASEDSEVNGTLVATPRARGPLTEDAKRMAQQRHREAIERALACRPVDLVHMHGQDFTAYLPAPGVPVLVTLHVPRQWYGEALRVERPGTFFHCVSTAQRRTWPAEIPFLPVIENGVEMDRFSIGRRKRNYALALGRICPEKGYHLALDASARAGLPLILAGEVFPYEAHARYFEEEIRPRLNGRARFVGAVAFERKRRLLAGARCLLAPSLAPETSSLAAMEALASGTPVVAFPSGALAEIVEHGVTGYLVRDGGEMAEALAEVKRIDPATCRKRAQERFSATRTIARYFELYQRLVGAGVPC